MFENRRQWHKCNELTLTGDVKCDHVADILTKDLYVLERVEAEKRFVSVHQQVCSDQ